MAKVVITIQDTEEGLAKIMFEPDSPINTKDPENLTPAQVIAFKMLMAGTSEGEIKNVRHTPA